MTKDALKQEAEEYANNLLFVYETDIVQRIVRERVRLALIDVLEPREKQIQIDAEQIRALQKQNGELTDKVRKLEQHIEEMKNWCNCKNYQQCLIELAEQGKGMKPSECCVNCKKWEIKEK